MRISIIGGHGKVALLTAPLLVKDGHEVLSIIRDEDHIIDVEATGANSVYGDVEELDQAGFERILKGTDVVVWSAGAGGGNPQRTYAVDRDAAILSMEAAKTVGVKQYVMVSYITSGRDDVPEDNSFVHYARAKAEADAHLRESGLPYVILGPGALTFEEPTGKIAVGDDLTSGAVSRANVAKVIAEVVGKDLLDGKTINFVDGETPIREALGL